MSETGNPSGKPWPSGRGAVTTTILHGDCRDILPTLPANHFDAVITSPPYWGLRDYGVAGQIGLEPTMTAYLETMVVVCREIRRVLKRGGTFWLNVGDSYARDPGKGQHKPGDSGKQDYIITRGGGRAANQGIPIGLKGKDLCMIPNRLAIALQDDGWWVRSEIVWNKPNPMPESVTDRPTCAHEKIWLLTKSARYFYDADAIREPLAPSSIARLAQDVESQAGSSRANGGGKTNGPMKAVRSSGMGANARNVWTIASQPFKGAHFATFPPKLAERCILAGCPKGGTVLDPFAGAGTTGLVADRLGRNATLIELNPKYADMTKRRIEGDAGLFSDTTTDSGNG